MSRRIAFVALILRSMEKHVKKNNIYRISSNKHMASNKLLALRSAVPLRKRKSKSAVHVNQRES